MLERAMDLLYTALNTPMAYVTPAQLMTIVSAYLVGMLLWLIGEWVVSAVRESVAIGRTAGDE